LALSDLLVAKKSDYYRMKDHCNQTICDLEDEVQRLKSEKARLLDRLQLPESERASLAAEENEIAELKRRLEDYEIRYGDAVTENDDLRQEVQLLLYSDLQLSRSVINSK
jgi:predicted RNase H-like nuclease (RuvC/YqgF family)